MTTEAQSVSGMKPILTSGFSGASDPAAQAPARTMGSTRLMMPAAAPAPSSLRRPASGAPEEGVATGEQSVEVFSFIRRSRRKKSVPLDEAKPSSSRNAVVPITRHVAGRLRLAVISKQ